MPSLQCPGCGKIVRFEGVAGVCPNCAAVVQARKPAAPAQIARPAPSTTSKNKSRPTAGHSPPDLESIQTDGEEVFEPGTTAPIRSGPLAGLDKRLIYGIGGALAIVFLFGLYIALRTPTPDVVAVAPPPVTHTPVVPVPTPDANDLPKPLDQRPTPPPTSLPVVAAASKPAWMGLKPIVPTLAAKPITDQLVEHSIKKAVAYLKSQFDGDQLKDPHPEEDTYAGTDALAVYSLLHAGEAIDDSDLGISDPFMQGLLTRLKTYDMSHDKAIYGRALRASALAMFDRDQDATQLGKDRKYLLDSELGGAYTYKMPDKGSLPDNGTWDNSNSQYGVLGIWAAVQVGISAPDKYWADVEHHWLKYQTKEGGWSYNGPRDPTLTMTCAGITSLCVTSEQLELIASKGKHDAHPEMTQAINRGLDWLGDGDRLLTFNSNYPGYSLYGVERAALATGFRFFGTHDWYRDLGAEQIKEQQPDGEWLNGGDGTIAETAFRILFLSRGRQPIFMNKLRFDGDWNDRPRDAAKLTEYASKQLEKPFAWGVADLSRKWSDWMESPYLLITTDEAPSFSDEDCQKLRAYTDAGGMIFIHNEYASKEVDEFVDDIVHRIYPEYPMKTVAPDDLLYSTVFPLKTKAPLLKSVSNGTRTMMVYSPTDITQDWVRYKAKDMRSNVDRELGLNLFVATAGKSDFRNRLNSPYEEPPDFAPIGTLPIAQIRYPGPWNPEPKAYERFGRWFQNQTSIKLDVQPTSMLLLSAKQRPIAFLTGNSAVDFSKMDLHALHQFVNDGGVLMIDSTGGNKEFAASVRESLLPSAFPGIETADLPADHPILAGGLCMDAIPKPKLRNYASLILNGVTPNVQYATVGKGAIIVSDLDVTTGLLSAGTYGILGYSNSYSQSLMKNVILWALSRYSS
jgi:hypothetical protein